MFEFHETLFMAIAIYLGACYILYQTKHEKMFDKQGNFKCFGLNKDETVFPFWLVTTMIGLFAYYLLTIKNRDYM